MISSSPIKSSPNRDVGFAELGIQDTRPFSCGFESKMFSWITQSDVLLTSADVAHDANARSHVN